MLKKVGIIVVIALIVFSCKSKKKTVQHRTTKKNTQTTTVIKKPATNASTITTTTVDYIDRFKETAMQSMRDYKIPASITLAQGILESSSGNSELTRKSNNHFGIKCHKEWTGKRTYHDDDEKGECFRVYDDPSNSYKDHSLFLTSRSRYAKLFKLKPGDYVSWAKGLSEAGYATDRRYPAKLIALIEKYDLHTYDTQVLGKPFKKIKSSNTENIYVVSKGDTLYSISKKYGLTVDELKKLNNLDSNTISVGQELIIKK